MKRKVYIETSVVSYFTARLSRDLVVAAHQELTQPGGTLSVIDSIFTFLNSYYGKPQKVIRRIVPEKVVEDALHVAVAARQEIDSLLTWNCRHIANAEVIEKLEATCLEFALLLPRLCTSDQSALCVRAECSAIDGVNNPAVAPSPWWSGFPCDLCRYSVIRKLRRRAPSTSVQRIPVSLQPRDRSGALHAGAQ